MSFVCLREIISRLAISQGQATPGASGDPGLCPCSAVLSPWVFGRAHLLSGTPPHLGNRQAPPDDSSNCSSPSSLELELLQIRVHTYGLLRRGPCDMHKAVPPLTLRCCQAESELNQGEKEAQKDVGLGPGAQKWHEAVVTAHLS